MESLDRRLEALEERVDFSEEILMDRSQKERSNSPHGHGNGGGWGGDGSWSLRRDRAAGLFQAGDWIRGSRALSGCLRVPVIAGGWGARGLFVAVEGFSPAQMLTRSARRLSGCFLGIMLLDLGTESVRELMPVGLNPQYVETGYMG